MVTWQIVILLTTLLCMVGAVFFYRESTVTSCNFVNNTAFNDGGAVRFMRTSTVTSCNFTGNQAYIGGALCLKYTKCQKL